MSETPVAPPSGPLEWPIFGEHQTWGDFLDAEPQWVNNVLKALHGAAGTGGKTILRVAYQGVPTLVIGFEPEGSINDDFDEDDDD